MCRILSSGGRSGGDRGGGTQVSKGVHNVKFLGDFLLSADYGQ